MPISLCTALAFGLLNSTQVYADDYNVDLVFYSDDLCSTVIHEQKYIVGNEFGIGDTYEGCYNLPGNIGTTLSTKVKVHNMGASCILYTRADCKDYGGVNQPQHDQLVNGGSNGHPVDSACHSIQHGTPFSFYCQASDFPPVRREL